jgi:hypothetical protein
MNEKGVRSVSARSEDAELITNSDLIVAANELMDGIELDVASSNKANTYVQAPNFFTPSDDGLNAQQWYGNVYLFPPAGAYFWDKKNERWKMTRASTPSLTSSHAVWFRKLYHAWLAKEIRQGLYFSNCPDMIRYEPKIFSFPVCILRSAPVLRRITSQGEKMQRTCTSLIVYLPPTDRSDDAIERFVDIYTERGHILV